eukprot:8594012-Alexandrium_andersonii.AAC.1
MAFAEVATLKCGNIDPPAYDLPDTIHDSEHWWSDFFTLACGALRMCVTPRPVSGSCRQPSWTMNSWRTYPRGTQIGAPKSSHVSLGRPSRTGPEWPSRHGRRRT